MLRTALLRPREFFERGTPSLAATAGAVLVVAVLTSAVGGVLGLYVAGQTDATFTVENGDRPPDWVCDDAGATPDGEPFPGCDEPRYETREASAIVLQAFGDVLPVVFLGLLATWPLLAAGLWVGSTVAGGDGGIRASLAVAGWGMLPDAVVAALSLAVLVATFQGADLSGGSPDALAREMRGAIARATGGTTLLSVLGAGWRVYVWKPGLESVQGLSAAAALAVAGTVSGLVLVVGLL